MNFIHHLVCFPFFSPHSIGCELLRLFGNVSVLRAPLESLFHRLLVTDHFATRIEIFKTIKEVMN